MIDWDELTCDCERCKQRKDVMDKKIKKIIKKEKGLEKSTKSLLKEDKKHDKVVERAEKIVKKKR